MGREVATGESRELEAAWNWDVGVRAIRWRWRRAIRESLSLMKDGGGPDRAVVSGKR